MKFLIHLDLVKKNAAMVSLESDWLKPKKIYPLKLSPHYLSIVSNNVYEVLNIKSHFFLILEKHKHHGQFLILIGRIFKSPQSDLPIGSKLYDDDFLSPF